MTLKEWLDLNGISAEKFAAQIGYTKQGVYLWTSGKAIPGQRAMGAIGKATRGQVRPNDFYDPIITRAG